MKTLQEFVDEAMEELHLDVMPPMGAPLRTEIATRAYEKMRIYMSEKTGSQVVVVKQGHLGVDNGQ